MDPLIGVMLSKVLSSDCFIIFGFLAFGCPYKPSEKHLEKRMMNMKYCVCCQTNYQGYYERKKSFTTCSIRFKMVTFNSLLRMIPLKIKKHIKDLNTTLEKSSQDAVLIQRKIKSRPKTLNKQVPKCQTDNYSLPIAKKSLRAPFFFLGSMFNLSLTAFIIRPC